MNSFLRSSMCTLSMCGRWSWGVRRHPHGNCYHSIHHRLLSVHFLLTWFDGFASLLPPSQVPDDVNAQCKAPDLLVDKAFLGWQPDSSRLTSQPGKPVLEKRLLQWGLNQHFAVFSSWSPVVQGALCTSKEFRPCLCHQRAQVCPAGTAPRVHHSLAASGRKPRCHGEMLADQHWFAHTQSALLHRRFLQWLPTEQ